MSFLTSAELTQLRADAADLLPGTCDIVRRTITNDQGHASESTATAVSATPCRLDPASGRSLEGMIADQEKGKAYYMLTVGWNVDLRDGDQISFDSNTYRVVQLHDDHSYRMVRRALVVKDG